MVKVLYKLFLAAMVVLFIGFGVSVFYSAPKSPEYPNELRSSIPNEMTASQKKVESKFYDDQRAYQDKFEKYNRNASAILIGISILLLILSLTVLLSVDIIGDGVLLGGLLTLIYGMGRGIASNDSKYQFIVVSIGLLVALALGYIKFVRAEKKR